MDAPTVEVNSACWCFTGIAKDRAIVYLLNQIAGGTMTAAEVEANSACWCFTGITFERAVAYLLAQIAAGGGGGGGGTAGTTNGNYAGVAPPVNGSVPTFFAYDTSTGFLWYNSGTIAAPVWNNV